MKKYLICVYFSRPNASKSYERCEEFVGDNYVIDEDRLIIEGIEFTYVIPLRHIEYYKVKRVK